MLTSYSKHLCQYLGLGQLGCQLQPEDSLCLPFVPQSPGAKIEKIPECSGGLLGFPLKYGYLLPSVPLLK